MLAPHSDARVLVLDDNAEIVDLLRMILRTAGLRDVHGFTDPAAGVAALPELRPDLVLADLHMPGVDGYEVIRRVAEHASGAYVPVLVLTADTSPAAVQKALGLGARDFLTKPFNPVEVVLRVRNLLETRELYLTLRQHNRWLRAQVAGRTDRRPEALSSEHERVSAALRGGELVMVFQPVLDVGGGGVVGVEALARFPAEPVRGPESWFAEASRVGLGVALELAAVRQALACLDRIPPPLFLSVNVSPATLVSREFAVAVGPEHCPRLVLELTEHVPVENYEPLTAAAAGFRRHGARLAVDDTGAGYAGLRHLLALGPEVVKLDGFLTRGVDGDPARRALAGALEQFTRETGARLIAEGVETAAELAALRGLGVCWAQGYHLGRPQPLGALFGAGQ